MDFSNVPLDTALTLSSAAGTQDLPSVASPGSGFLVVWYDASVDPSGDVYGTRVSSAGAVLDSQPIVVSSSANGERRAAVASNGSSYLVVWSDLRAGAAGYDLWGARVSLGGVVLDPSGFPVVKAAGEQDTPALASDGTDYLVAFRDTRAGGSDDLWANRIGGGGTVADTTGFAVCTEANAQSLPRVAWAGGQYLVAWQDWRNGTDSDLYGALVTATGPGTSFALGSATANQSAAAVAPAGTGFLVAWQDRRSNANGDLYGRSVSASGALGAETALVSGGANGSPALGALGSELLLAWECYRSGTLTDICGARLSATPEVLSTFDISKASRSERSPAVASDGAEYLVAWLDGRSSTGGDTYAARVSAGGTLLDPAGLLINDSANANSAPAVASQSRGSWLVAYDRFFPGVPLEANRIRAALVTDTVPCSSDAECSDGDPCTADLCNAANVCEHTFACLPDAGTPPDAATPPDAQAPGPDAASPTDAAVVPDAGDPDDASAAPPDAALAADASDAASASPDAQAPAFDAASSSDAAAVPDAGDPDDAAAAPPDGATAGDAQPPPPDASAGADAEWTPPDAQTADRDAAAPAGDAGTSGPMEVVQAGCACSASDAGAPGWSWLALAAARLLRRRAGPHSSR